ncbi:MAG: class I SAM-dependent methyltransferase [Planctomycetota bacterium]
MEGEALAVELLDAERALHDDDLRYWGTRARGKVLELGCGTGRLAALLRRQAVWYVGLEPSAAMLDRARRNAPGVPLMRGDLRRFAARGIGAVFSLYGSFQALLSADDRARCLSCARESLDTDGCVVLDLENHSPRAAAAAPRKLAGEITSSGKRWSRFETIRREGGTVEVKSEWYQAGKPVAEATRRLAALGRRSLEQELRAAGFELFAIFGDWREGRFEERGERMVIEAAKV